MKKDVLDQYHSVRRGVGWRDLSDRGKVRVTGPDRISFLHSMISNDVEGLSEGEGHYGTFLTATGKILADFYYYRFSEYVLIDIAEKLLAGFVETLSKYIIMDDVELEDVSQELNHFAVEGLQAKELLQAILGGRAPSAALSANALHWRSRPVWWLRKDLLAEPGFEIILPKPVSGEFENSLAEEGRSCGLVEIGPEAFELLRMERGIPINGIDFSERNNPVEARLDEAYSLKKGCYIGQEVVSKATLIGSVPKALSRLKLEDPIVPAKGAPVFAQDGREVGRITSAVFSPRLERPIALAFLKKGFWDSGSVHRVVGPLSEALSAEVVESFE